MNKELAYAKINLALDVVGKRADGYHDLKMIMIPIELHDVLTFEEADVISLVSNIDIENNAIIKTAERMKERYNIQTGAKITLKKNIPIGAGLGGGSADIAATIRGLNQLWELNLELEAFYDLTLSLGSDTLFCLYNKAAYVYGRGESLLFIDPPKIQSIYLFPSGIEVSTRKIFEHHKLNFTKNRFDKLFRLYLDEKFKFFFSKTYNNLLRTTLGCYPELKKQYKTVRKINRTALMSGSGSTFYILSFTGNDSNLLAKIQKYNIQYIKSKPKT